MTAQDYKDQAEIVRRFLLSPLSRNCFNDFFGLCVGETIHYLRCLKSAGWRLPVDQVQSEQPLIDITNDVIGFFLSSRRGRPFDIIFEYYRRHGISDFTASEAGDLADHFHILLRGFIRKKVTKLAGDYEPEITLLKRRIAEVLRSPTYQQKLLPGDHRESIYLSANQYQLRNELSAIPDDRLQRLVLTAFLETVNRSDWCNKIFELLDQEADFRNAIPRSILISTMIAVNAEYVDALEYVQERPAGPLGELRLRKIVEAVRHVSAWIETGGIAPYLHKGRITPDEAAAMIKACNDWLRDFCLCGEADSIPSYFFHFRSEVDQKEYQLRVKNIMDSVTRKALEEVRRRLREDSTIWSLGDYIPDE